MLYPRGDIWWCKFKHRGRPHRESTDVRVSSAGSRAKARQAESVIKARVILEEGPGGRAATSRVTLGILEEAHLEYLENKGYDELRLETVSNLHRHIQRHLGGEHRDAMTLTVADLEGYEGLRRKEKCRGEFTKGQTIRRERQALRRAMKISIRSGIMDRMPFDWDLLEPITSDPKKKSQTAKLRDIKTVELVLSKLSAKAKHAKHEGICRLVMVTGLRGQGELRRAGEFEVRMLPRGSRAAAVLVVPDDGSKTADPRDIPLSRYALDLYNHVKDRLAIADVAHALKRASNKAGIDPGLTLRDLRKFHGSHAARRDLGAAQRLLGHRKVSTTALYVDADLSRKVTAVMAVTKAARGGHTSGAQSKRRVKKRSDIKGARSSGG